MRGGTLRQSQTMTMYMSRRRSRNFDFGYAAAVAWMLFVLIGSLGVVNVCSSAGRSAE